MNKRFFRSGLLLCMMILFTGLLALHSGAQEGEAQPITAAAQIETAGFSQPERLWDGDALSAVTGAPGATVRLEYAEGIGGISLVFEPAYGTYTVTDAESGQSVRVGENEFLHDYLDLVALFGAAPRAVTLTFDGADVFLCEVTAYSPGTPPAQVQRWEAPCSGGADLVLFSAHGDDDQLFFAGLLPYYAGQCGYRVQVVYLTDHRNDTNLRVHEMLNGLWAVGVRAYPVFGTFPDFRIDDLQQSYDQYAALGVSQEQMQLFVVRQLRRFRPLVAVGHDLAGEYGHGMHMVYADLLTRALDLSADGQYDPPSAEEYGVWQVPKTYLHLYGENPIVMNYDVPLSAFGGMTAFEVTQKLGYPCHVSQQYTWFTDWINGAAGEITRADQITTYSPCKYGLYRSTVGADSGENDMFEHLTTYGQQEEERKAREEAQRLKEEQEREAKALQERQSQEALRAAQAAMAQEQARLQEEQRAQAQNRRVQLIACAAALAAALLYTICLIGIRKKRNKR